MTTKDILAIYVYLSVYTASSGSYKSLPYNLWEP